MDFGSALHVLKAGGAVTRTSWNGPNQFVYLVPGNSYPAQTGVAKNFFGKDSSVPYAPYLALKNAQDIVTTWAPSVGDVLADDWTAVFMGEPLKKD